MCGRGGDDDLWVVRVVVIKGSVLFCFMSLFDCFGHFFLFVLTFDSFSHSPAGLFPANRKWSPSFAHRPVATKRWELIGAKM